MARISCSKRSPGGEVCRGHRRLDAGGWLLRRRSSTSALKGRKDRYHVQNPRRSDLLRVPHGAERVRHLIVSAGKQGGAEDSTTVRLMSTTPLPHCSEHLGEARVSGMMATPAGSDDDHQNMLKRRDYFGSHLHNVYQGSGRASSISIPSQLLSTASARTRGSGSEPLPPRDLQAGQAPAVSIGFTLRRHTGETLCAASPCSAGKNLVNSFRLYFLAAQIRSPLQFGSSA